MAEDYDYTVMITILHWPKHIILVQKPTLMAVAWVLISTFIGGTVLKKCPRRSWLHWNNYRRTLTLMCQNSSW